MARHCETCERPLSRLYVRHRNPRTGAKECDECITATASVDGDFARFLDTIEDGLGDIWMLGDPKDYQNHYDALPLKTRQLIDEADEERDRMLRGGSLQTIASAATERVTIEFSFDTDEFPDAEHVLWGVEWPDGVEARQVKTGHLQFEAHDAGDGETIYHCPFCGSGNVVARSDGSAECGHCHTVFTVQMQPQHPYTPQTIDGQPYDNPDLPGQVTDPTAEGTQPQQPPDGETAPGQESLIFTPPGMGDTFDPSKAPVAEVAASKRWFLTADGDPLPENSYLKHLAIVYADDREEAIAQVRAEHGEHDEG